MNIRQHARIITATCALVLALASPITLAAPDTAAATSATVITTPSITLVKAKAMAQAAEAKATAIGVPMVIAIVDPHGNLVLHERMENALLVSIDVSIKKAYSAVALKMSTYQLGQATQPGAELYGIQHSDEKLITFGGGFPILMDGKIIGAIGVSGGSVAEDMAVATAGLDALK